MAGIISKRNTVVITKKYIKSKYPPNFIEKLYLKLIRGPLTNVNLKHVYNSYLYHSSYQPISTDVVITM